MLKVQSAIGIQAEELMVETQKELERHNYERAVTNLAKAKSQYEQLPPEQRPDQLILTYEALATAGGTMRLRSLAPRPVSRAVGATIRTQDRARFRPGPPFPGLGDEERRDQANSVCNKLDSRQRRLILLLESSSLIFDARLARALAARSQTIGAPLGLIRCKGRCGWLHD